MKKIFLITSCLFAFTLSTKAQEISDHAIGLRFSGGAGFGSEISYQKKLSDENRLELNVGFTDNLNDFKTLGIYQWVWNLEERFNWYAGVGAGLVAGNDFTLFAAGNVGIEYDFNIPLLISLDFRPEFGFIGDNGLASVFSLGLRYQF